MLYIVTATTPDGQRDTQTVEAADKGKAKTTFMAFTKLRARGQHVDFTVRTVVGATAEMLAGTTNASG